ncbi:phosphohydrolase [Streptomyces thermoviolaceus subsp. thermoviolaceus]|uniref:HD domain-containing protein n=1 Tax=Streptomyces thermoviolaceus subsp. thermoviolaceus TaxID=66860 RepID=A0ABX0YZW5_STRTL|nr:HD domain-containing protein [Streptomyces thermoviolaceus]NJP16520.1 HD domain-containing protein [Streptomyces thermoviolaceus subsp. thermoviolaceus]WTD46499.1 HD domain-containing protein [Streptomyces thermoviolaceus]GHB04029.1 phosphohydrolase [Streptomyces thermoviolaceus subsp. thermoviolaceus]
MSETIAGVDLPDTAAATQAACFLQETGDTLLYHHSRRVFLFASLHARALGLTPDAELLYVAAMFHDTGLSAPFSATAQRFELDGADHARSFLLEHGFPEKAAEVVWSAVALHTTPGIPARLGPETAALNAGVLTDAVGLRLDELDRDRVDEIVAAHPRGDDFKQRFLRLFVEGLRHRPDTTYGTVDADVLEHYVPGFRRTSMVERVLNAPWPT